MSAFRGAMGPNGFCAGDRCGLKGINLSGENNDYDKKNIEVRTIPQCCLRSVIASKSHKGDKFTKLCVHFCLETKVEQKFKPVFDDAKN